MTNRRWAMLLAALLLAGLALFVVQQREQARQREELRIEAQGMSTVLTASFAKASRLKVGEVNGSLDVTSVDPGMFEFLRSSQSVTLPYSVDYEVDLADLDPGRFRWNAETRTLLVEVPPVVAAPPNIDEARRRLRATSGLFVTRAAADNLSRRASTLATRAAAREAQKPVHVAKAEANARSAIARLVETPLRVAGYPDVKVVVRFPQDGYRDSERWDVTPSFDEILKRQQRRADGE